MAWGWRSAPRPDASTRSRPIWCICSRRRSLPVHAPGPCLPGPSAPKRRSCNPGIPSPGPCRGPSGPVHVPACQAGSCRRVVQPGVLGLSGPRPSHRGATPGACVPRQPSATGRWGVRGGRGPAKAPAASARFRLGPICPARASRTRAVSGSFARGAVLLEQRSSSNPARFPALPHRSPLKAVRG